MTRVKKFWRFLSRLDNHALSLTEALVAAGISAGLAVGYLQISDNTNKAQKKIETGFEIDMIVLDMAQILSNDGACAKTLRGRTSGALDDIRSSSNKVLYRKSRKYGQNLAKIQSMNLVNANISPVDGFGSVELEVRFEKTSKLIKGKKTEVRKIPLLVRQASGTVVCNPDNSMRINGSANKREMCDSIGGTMSGGKCRPPHLGASCSTYIVGLKSDGTAICEPKYTFP